VFLLTTERFGRKFAGRTFWLYMLLYAVSRYVIEFYRDDPRGSVGPWSTSQFVSLILAPVAIGMLIYLGRWAGGPAHSGARRQKAA
jgi:phosphatidylglycerol:prolipoprotein diacylglycerol transferase